TGPDFSSWSEAKRPDTLTGYGGSTLRRLDLTEDDETGGYAPDGTRLVEALAAWPGASGNQPEPIPEVPSATEPNLILTYLARAKQTINEVNEGIDRRMAGHGAVTLRVLPPSTADQAAALMELIELGAVGYYSAEQQSRVKAQLSSIGEAAIRLRSLLELCNAGHMTIGEAAAKRDRIVGSIAMLLESD
ncbi:MAG TPA: hypothetical protein PK691_08685, partial [Thermomicrobiales bacterium]|nr:hypothetical protein [Thermomicrobiales bacterium]